MVDLNKRNYEKRSRKNYFARIRKVPSDDVSGQTSREIQQEQSINNFYCVDSRIMVAFKYLKYTICSFGEQKKIFLKI